MRRQDSETKDAIGLQGHQDTDNEGHHETSGHETKVTIGLQGHQDTNNEGHHEKAGHKNEGHNWTSGGTSGHKQRRTQ